MGGLRSRNSAWVALSVALAAALGAARSAVAATVTWVGADPMNDLWSTAANWSPNPPALGSGVLFNNGTGSFTSAGQTLMNTPCTLSSVTFNVSITTGTIGGDGSNTMSIEGGGSITVGSNTGTLQLGVSTNMLPLDLLGQVQFSAPGATQLIVDAGLLQGSGGIIKIGSGRLRFNTDNSGYSGAITVSAGTLILFTSGGIGSGAVALDGGTLSLQNSATSFSNSITVDVATGNAFDAPGIITTASGFLSGSGGFTKTGSGTLTLSHTNNYSGGTTIANGMLTLGSSSGTGTGTVAVNSGSVFNVNGFAPVIAELSGAGSVTLGSGTLTSGDSGSSTFSGAISGSGTMVLQGAGTLSLTGTGSSFSGGTFITGGGMLSISADGGLGAAPGSPAANITFGGSGGTLQATSNVTLSSDRNVLLSANATFDTQANTFTIPGAVSGTGSLTQVGSGTLALTNYSTAAGVTILGGTFLLSGTGNSLVGINGTAGNVTLASGGSANSDGVRVNTLSVNGNWGIHSAGSASGVSVLSNLVLATNTTGAYTGTLDIADDKLIVETTGTSGNMATILSSLTAAALSGSSTGFEGGTWTGTGLTSSKLEEDYNEGTNNTFHTTMAIAENNLLGVPFTSYAGQPVDSNSILVTRALMGDANLDNTTNNTDLVVLMTHFGASGSAANWATGDFNNDGTVDNTDLVALLTDYGQSLPGGYSVAPGDGVAPQALAGAVPVPEPFSLAGDAHGGAASGAPAAWAIGNGAGSITFRK